MKLLRVLLVLALVATVTLFSGCRKKPTPLPTAGTHGPGTEEFGLTTPKPGSDDPESSPFDKVPPRAGGTFVPVGENNGRWHDVVYFAFDRYDVGDAEKGKLEALAKYLEANPTYCIQIEGHCDERGSDEYNRGLSERRAIAIRDYLVSLSIADTRMETVGFGEEKPAVANAASEADHALNRRGEFVIGTRQ